MKNNDTQYEMLTAQLPLLIDSTIFPGLDVQKMLTTSAALLSVMAPSYANGAMRMHCPESQIVLMQCVANSMPDEIIKRDMRERLREMESMRQDWIDGAKVIPHATITHAEELLERSHDLDLCDWEIVPYINGTILMTYDVGDVIASINITESGASAIIDSPKKYITIEETDFNVEDIYSIVWRLSPLNKERICG